jgi:hypothetical protein
MVWERQTRHTLTPINEERAMSIVYEVIPWDCEGYAAIYNRQFPTSDTLEEAARLLTSPADSIVAWEHGRRRALTADEKLQFESAVSENMQRTTRTA